VLCLANSGFCAGDRLSRQRARRPLPSGSPAGLGGGCVRLGGWRPARWSSCTTGTARTSAPGPRASAIGSIHGLLGLVPRRAGRRSLPQPGRPASRAALAWSIAAWGGLAHAARPIHREHQTNRHHHTSTLRHLNLFRRAPRARRPRPHVALVRLRDSRTVVDRAVRSRFIDSSTTFAPVEAAVPSPGAGLAADSAAVVKSTPEITLDFGRPLRIVRPAAGLPPGADITTVSGPGNARSRVKKPRSPH